MKKTRKERRKEGRAEGRKERKRKGGKGINISEVKGGKQVNMSMACPVLTCEILPGWERGGESERNSLDLGKEVGRK